MDEQSMNTKIDQTLMKLRKEKKISREEVATKMGVTSVAVYYWENGKRSISAVVLKNFCDAINVDLDYFIKLVF